MKLRKNRITQEQLIGIVCGSTSVFFSILAIIILSYQRRYNNQTSEFGYLKVISDNDSSYIDDNEQNNLKLWIIQKKISLYIFKIISLILFKNEWSKIIIK